MHANRIQRLDDPAPPPRVTALDLAALIRQAGGAELKKIELSQLPWEELCRAQPSKPTQTAEKAGVSIDVNSGGAVFFLLFKSHPSEGQTSSYRRMPATPVSPSHAAREEGERACVLKVCGGMGATHSEFFASQLCAPLGVTAPQMRLLRRSHPDWERLRVAVEKVKAPLAMPHARLRQKREGVKRQGEGGCGERSSRDLPLMRSKVGRTPCVHCHPSSVT